MTLSRLSLRNARRQARDYLVYFVTMVLSVALVYAFNGLVFSQELLALSGMMRRLPLVIVLVSIVVVGILGWLVQYTTGFMLARRSRELGTYILIGLESKQVARLFFLENLAVGGVALVLGTLLGSLLFQILRAVTLTLFHAPYTFSFAFSWGAVGLTLFYFALIYLFALSKSHRRIRTMKICELISFDRQNEGEIITKGGSRRRIFVVSIALGLIGTILLLSRNFQLGILGAGCIILFLYGFFISFSSGVPAYFDNRPEKKYRGQRLLIFRSLSAKLATMGVVMATISLLFTATILSQGMGMLLSAVFQNQAQQTTCFDLFISSASPEEARFDRYLDYIRTNIPVRDSRQYRIYQGENLDLARYGEVNASYHSVYDYDTVIKAGDYAALRAMLGYPPILLEPGRYLIHCMPYLEEAMAGYERPLTIGGQTLTLGGVHTELLTQFAWDGNGRGFVLVVPDEAADARPVSHSIYAAMTADPVTEADYMALRRIRNDLSSADLGYDTLLSKAAVEAESAFMSATLVFPLYYLALTLTMVSATILTIQQLSETDRYRRQFALLQKLGMDQREMKRALRRQFALYYAMPAMPALLVSVPVLLACGGTADPGVFTGPGQFLAMVGVVLGLFFAIYLVYILLAYTSLKRNVLPI